MPIALKQRLPTGAIPKRHRVAKPKTDQVRGKVVDLSEIASRKD